MKPSSSFRWYICGLLFFATTLNYVDRQVLSLLKPVLEKELHWNETEYGWIVFAFQLAYAAMMPVAGRLLDWLGTRMGYMLAVIVWSISAMAHALAGSAAGFSAARFALGFGESANFPAAIKTVSVWFPKSERAFATGIFNSGANVGAIVAPVAVPFLAARWGWKAAFILTGALGFLWVVLWLLTYREPSVSEQAEAPSKQSVPYSELIKSRAAWAYFIGKFLTDPVWWFYLFWLPGWLNETYKLDLSTLGPPLIVIYFASSFGSVGGGWIPAALMRRGWSVNAARKTAMLICALAVTSAIFVPWAGANLNVAVALVAIAAAAHQGWSANIYTINSDVFPSHVVASSVGFGGMGGAIGGLLVAPAIGAWLDISGKAYGPLFVIAGTMYLIALGIIHLLVPKIEPRVQG